MLVIVLNTIMFNETCEPKGYENFGGSNFYIFRCDKGQIPVCHILYVADLEKRLGIAHCCHIFLGGNFYGRTQ
jgi:hypothetical protein